LERNLIFCCLDLDCEKGETFDRSQLGCKKCLAGTFSLGGGFQYTFGSFDNITSIPSVFSLESESFIGFYDSTCKKKE
jgi:hypothetical protein